ncbi:MAG: PPC domain-containing protein [Anaerolineae bacterium]
MVPSILRVMLRWQTVALLAGSALWSAVGCSHTPEVIVLAPTPTSAGAVVPTRAPTGAPIVSPSLEAATESPAPVALLPTTAPASETPAPTTTEPPTASSTVTPTTPAIASETPFAGVMRAGEQALLAVGQAAVGSTLNGDITDAAPWAIYPLKGQAGEYVDLKLDTSADLQPLMLFLDPSGREIARTRAETSAHQGLIRGVELTSTESHYVVVTRLGGSDGFSSGSFSLTVSPGNSDLKTGVFSQSTTYETLDTGAISDADPQQVFTFDGLAGDVISVQATVTDGTLDPRLTLTDALGNILAANDDDPLGSTFDSSISRFVLPADTVYSLVVDRYGETTGDFRLKLTREGQSGPGSPLQSQMDVVDSGSIRDDNVFVTDYRAGDQINDSGQELRVQSLVTFHLPELPEGTTATEAQLVLNVCSEGGAGFAGLGSLSVYLDPYGELSAPRDYTRPRPGARVLTEISSCQPVDVTDAVAAAYAAGDSIIQFRLAFRAANNNGQGDEVRFDPRLTISAGA